MASSSTSTAPSPSTSRSLRRCARAPRSPAPPSASTTTARPFPLVGGVYNSRAKALIALEATETTVFQRVLDGLARRIPPVRIENAPVHENVLTGDAIDLTKIPIPKYSPDE
jgi:3-polyprenyl-4-hydroxybenzoate decarboxylase